MGTLFHLIGYPGTGKYTIAKAMRERLEAAGSSGRVVDNHYVNNVVFGLLEPGAGVPEEAWARCGEVWEAVLKTMETLSPAGWWFVLTNFLVEEQGDQRWVERVATAAERRGSEFLPVLLRCSRGELLRRAVEPGRRARHKITDRAMLEHLLDTTTLLEPARPNRLTLDVTDLTANAAAERILAQAAG